MTNCCASRPPASESITCPKCGVRGFSVELRAVKALLVESALARVECVAHRFCPTPACPIVYYDETGGIYQRTEIRVLVWQKEPYGHRPICYCFGETEASIRDEIQRTHGSQAVQRVRAHIDAGRCACDVRNPRGVCCLGDLTRAVESVRSEFLAGRQAL